MSAAENGATRTRSSVEAELRAVTNAVPALISFFDAGYVCRFANDFHNEWFGRSPQSLIGLHMREFLGPEAFASRAPYLARASAGETVSFDAKVPIPSGEWRYAAISYIPRMGASGFEGFYVLVFDMTRRKQEMVGMLDLAHDAICLHKLDGTVIFWNAGCEEAYGWTREEAVGQQIGALTQCRFPIPLEELQRRLLEENHWDGEIVRTHRDGTEHVIDARWSLRKDYAGNPVEVLEMGRDITASRRAEADLQRSEYRYRNVFQAMAVSFWELDFSGVRAMLKGLKESGVTDFRAHFAANPGLIRTVMELTEVVDVNEKSLQLLGGGASREQLLGNVSRYWPVASEPIFAESVFASIEGKPHYEADTRLLTLDGKELDVHFTCCYPQRGDSAGHGLIGILDITERVRAHNELTRAQSQLAHAARISTLGELSASIAHEVNQPLTAAVTNAEASLRWLNRAEPDIDEAKAAIGRMISQAKRASDIIARIRAMSTNRAPEKTRFPCRGLVDDAVAILRRELADHQVRLRVILGNSLPDIEGDRVQLQQVVINLMVNAIQALGQIEDTRRALTVRLLPEMDRVMLDIEDNGPGVAPEHAARLFNAFFTTKADGMGMGLSICKSIVESHGGTIVLLPAAPQGALFRATLPASAAHAAI
jgi:PAS domain S-box-containing protein